MPAPSVDQPALLEVSKLKVTVEAAFCSSRLASEANGEGNNNGGVWRSAERSKDGGEDNPRVSGEVFSAPWEGPIRSLSVAWLVALVS